MASLLPNTYKIMQNAPIFGTGVSSFKDFQNLAHACDAAISHGIRAFDTAPSYKTEEILCAALHDIMKKRNIRRDGIYIQTKIDPIQMYNGNVETYLYHKLKAMQLDYVDALLIHWPVFEYLSRTWKELETIKKHGMARRIGICNLRIEHMKNLYGRGFHPDIIQIERHPLNTFEDERLFCIDNGIVLQDYSPLCKMHPLLRENPILHVLAEKYKTSIGLLILRWHLDTGAVPIFTSKNVDRISEYAGVQAFCISLEDCNKISSLNINHKLYLESLVCPGF